MDPATWPLSCVYASEACDLPIAPPMRNTRTRLPRERARHSESHQRQRFCAGSGQVFQIRGWLRIMSVSRGSEVMDHAFD